MQPSQHHALAYWVMMESRSLTPREYGKPFSLGFTVFVPTAGAPGNKRGKYTQSSPWNLQPVQGFDDAYGYILVEIDEGKATVTFKGSHKTSDCSDPLLEFLPIDKIVCDRPGCKTAPP